MSNIITSDGGQLSVRMVNSRFARKPIPALFSGWTKIRIAALLKVSDSGINITGTPRLAMGLCVGNTNIIGDPTTDHFVGMVSSSATWSRTAGPPIRYGALSFSVANRIGSTLTVGSAFTNSYQMHTGASSMLFVDIEKGSPTFGVTSFGYNATGVNPVVTEADFLLQSTAAVPAFLNHVYNSTARTTTIDEGVNGTFDHACMWWDRITPYVDVLSWRVYRLT